jgi:hypothetical protein
MKRLLIQLPIQLVVILIAGFIIGVTALIFAGTIMGVSAGVAPESSFHLVGPVVCPSGSEIEYDEGGESSYLGDDGLYHSGTSFSLSCVGADGTRSEGKELAAIGALFGLYFLVCFAPLFIPIALILFILVHFLYGAIAKNRQNPSTPA